MKKLLLLVILCFPFIAFNQINISVQLPASGMMQKEQLWNLIIMNSSENTEEIIILLDLKEAESGVSVLAGGSRSMLLPKGLKMVGSGDVAPVNYSISMNGFAGNILPLGSYIACFTVARFDDSREPLAYECVRINILPLSPPLLNTPGNMEKVTAPYPQFTWIPPAPIDMFQQLNYDLNVVEVNEGQSPEEAIMLNSSLFVRSNIQMPVFTYPSSYARLEEGKHYAWQITARNNGNYAVATEVWTFHLMKDTLVSSSNMHTYIVFDNSRKSSMTSFLSNEIYIKYYSYDKDYEASFIFSEPDGQVMKRITRKISYGDNYIHLKLDNSFKTGQIYKLQFSDPANLKRTAIFSINK